MVEIAPRHRRALANWTALNDYLRKCRSLADLDIVYKMELKRKDARHTFLTRMLGRGKVLRKIAERR